MNSFSPNTKAESDKVNANFTNISGAIRPSYGLAVDELLSIGTGKTLTVPVVHSSLTLIKVYATVKTAPTGASILVDINKNGTSIWNSNQGNRLAITAGTLYGVQTSFDTTSFVEGDLITLDIDQVGSTVAGESIMVILKFEHN